MLLRGLYSVPKSESQATVTSSTRSQAIARFSSDLQGTQQALHKAALKQRHKEAAVPPGTPVRQPQRLRKLQAQQVEQARRFSECASEYESLTTALIEEFRTCAALPS